MQKKYILGISINNITREEALSIAGQFLQSNKSHKVYTPNPEMAVKSQNDKYFADVLNNSDLNLCDGAGLSFFTKIPRFSGVDFMIELCRLAEKEGRSVYLLGAGSDDVVSKCAKELKNKFPGLNIIGYDKGPVVDESKILTGQGSELAEKIAKISPDILFVAFGMGKQEKWIDYNLINMPSVKIAVGVGGSFDFIAGSIKRAPCWMRKIGLEWMYRLFRQPKRIGRIFNATFKFVYLIIKEKFLNFYCRKREV